MNAIFLTLFFIMLFIVILIFGFYVWAKFRNGIPGFLEAFLFPFIIYILLLTTIITIYYFIGMTFKYVYYSFMQVTAVDNTDIDLFNEIWYALVITTLFVLFGLIIKLFKHVMNVYLNKSNDGDIFSYYLFYLFIVLLVIVVVYSVLISFRNYDIYTLGVYCVVPVVGSIFLVNLIAFAFKKFLPSYTIIPSLLYIYVGIASFVSVMLVIILLDRSTMYFFDSVSGTSGPLKST